MSRDEDMPDDLRTGPRKRIEACEARTFEAEARAQEAKSVASRALPRRSALTFSAITGIISALFAVAGGGFWLSQLAASKADAAEVQAMKQHHQQEHEEVAVLKAVLAEMRDDFKDFKKQINWLVRQRGGEPEKEKRGGQR